MNVSVSMKFLMIFLLPFAIFLSCEKKLLISPLTIAAVSMPDSTTNSYLALGDSYTIGEAVPYEDCFPAQLTEILRKSHKITDPLIIAKTGWTTDELAQAIKHKHLNTTFDLVTLLIGVNNQYRGRDTAEYRQEFTELLQTAIAFANAKSNHVIVISIPDYGVTPFSEGKDRAKIEKEIDIFNKINKEVALQFKAEYIDITPHSRTASADASLIASDGLHPSGKMYAYWAEKVSGKAKKILK